MLTRTDQLLDIASAISRGEVPEYQHNAFDLLLINLNGPEAFEVLSDLCRRFDSLKVSGNNMKGYYFLLPQLARQANTTEMPLGMPTIIDEHPELSSQLKQWYRYSA